MNNNAALTKERTLQLLADRATEGLDGDAAKELNDLLSSHPHYVESYFEPVAAAIDLTSLSPVAESLPGPCRDRVLADAWRFFGNHGKSETP